MRVDLFAIVIDQLYMYGLVWFGIGLTWDPPTRPQRRSLASRRAPDGVFGTGTGTGTGTGKARSLNAERRPRASRGGHCRVGSRRSAAHLHPAARRRRRAQRPALHFAACRGGAQEGGCSEQNEQVRCTQPANTCEHRVNDSIGADRHTSCMYGRKNLTVSPYTHKGVLRRGSAPTARR